jgi:hypothetical protein
MRGSPFDLSVTLPETFPPFPARHIVVYIATKKIPAEIFFIRFIKEVFM